MAKKIVAPKLAAPVYAVAPTQERESRWQCTGCKGYLAFSLPLDLKATAQLLQSFSRAHLRCVPGPVLDAQPLVEPIAPDGPTARAQARRNVLLALPRDHTGAERRELNQLEVQLTLAGVLTLSSTF